MSIINLVFDARHQVNIQVYKKCAVRLFAFRITTPIPPLHNYVAIIRALKVPSSLIFFAPLVATSQSPKVYLPTLMPKI
jgi:hypothetical protein